MTVPSMILYVSLVTGYSPVTEIPKSEKSMDVMSRRLSGSIALYPSQRTSVPATFTLWYPSSATSLSGESESSGTRTEGT